MALATGTYACTDAPCPPGSVFMNGRCEAEESLNALGDAGDDGGAFTLDADVISMPADKPKKPMTSGPSELDAAADAEPVDEACDAEGYVEVDGACVRDVCVLLEGESNPCGDNATCSSGFAKTPTCTCHEGYELEAGVCVRNHCVQLEGEDAPCKANEVCSSSADGADCTCAPTHGDCDYDAANGCETLITSTPAHCGVCGHNCRTGLGCQDGKCQQRLAMIAGGFGATYALTPDGDVYMWGTAPVPPGVSGSAVPQDTGLVAARHVAVAFDHGCIVRRSGNQLTCWGKNDRLQLGSGNTDASLVTTNIANVRAVAVREQVTCVIAGEAGHVFCFGSRATNLLGDGVTFDGRTMSASRAYDSTLPLPNIVDAVALGIGSKMGCALTGEGEVFCWGVSEGDTIAAYKAEPVRSTSNRVLTDAVALSVGGTHACALRQNQTVVCWGSASVGQLGPNAPPAARNRYVTIPLSGVTSIAAGMAHTCAVQTTGEVQCWGQNDQGQLGRGTFSSSESSPAVIPNFDGVLSVHSGNLAPHTCARTTRGAVYCWGYNYYGQLGVAAIAGQHTATPQELTSWP